MHIYIQINEDDGSINATYLGTDETKALEKFDQSRIELLKLERYENVTLDNLVALWTEYYGGNYDHDFVMETVEITGQDLVELIGSVPIAELLGQMP